MLDIFFLDENHFQRDLGNLFHRKISLLIEDFLILCQLLLSGSSHIETVLIGVGYRNCLRTLDDYVHFAIWMGQIQSKLMHLIVTYGLAIL